MKAILLFLFLSTAYTIQSQVDCTYQSLEFQEIEPLWKFQVIDSTFIGHIDTSLESGEFINFYIDGMDQLRQDHHSFIEGDYLYSVTDVEYDADLSGYYIEKIRLEDGQKMWDIKTDLRHEEHREKIIDIFVENDELKMYGVRTFWDEIDLNLFILRLGFVPTYFFRRSYNIHNGKLINHYTPNIEDNSIEMTSTININHLIKITDNEYDYITYNVNIYEGIYLERTKIDSFGIAITPVDTIRTYAYNHVNLDGGVFHASFPRILKHDSLYFYLEQLIPKEDSGLEYKSFLYKYDLDFNLIDSIDLTTLGLEKIGRLTLPSIINNKFVLRGCEEHNPNLFCRSLYILLDLDFKSSSIYSATYNGDYLAAIGFKSEILNTNNELIVTDRTLFETELNYISFFKSNDSGTLDSIKRMTINRENWVGFVDAIFKLDDGDFLIKITHSCYEDGKKKSWHPEWFRFDRADFDALVSTPYNNKKDQDFISVYPNPTACDVAVSLSHALSGIMQVYNANGQLISSRVIQATTLDYNLDFCDEMAGVYYVNILNDKGNTMGSKRFIKL